MIFLDNCSDSDYIIFRTEKLTDEEYEEITELIMKVLTRKTENRIIQKLDFTTSWITLNSKYYKEKKN